MLKSFKLSFVAKSWHIAILKLENQQKQALQSFGSKLY